jgi:Na+/alanine symporter
MHPPFPQINSVTATAALTSPWWLPGLHSVSTAAAEIVPILGALWLMVQIIVAIYKATRKKPDDKE